MLLGYIGLQMFCIYNLYYMLCYFVQEMFIIITIDLITILSIQLL